MSGSISGIQFVVIALKKAFVVDNYCISFDSVAYACYACMLVTQKKSLFAHFLQFRIIYVIMSQLSHLRSF